MNSTTVPEISNDAARLVALVRAYDGANLLHRGDELRSFVSRGIDDPKTLLSPHISTCGLFALAVWHALGVPHPLLQEPYVTGMAIAWVVQISHDLGAVRFPRQHGMPTAGSLMHYHSMRPSNNDHVEFCLSNWDDRHGPSPCEEYHGGGGRPNCGVTVNRTPERIDWNGGRPLQAWYDLAALLGGTVAVA